MKYFLETIAESLYSEFGNSLHRHCLVFPSRRAGLYFTRYLSSCIDKPVWMPATITINDLFRSFSPLKVVENEILLAELYKAFRSVSGSRESFDDFYFWGDMLLNDFDDVDKYLADAASVFRNVTDLRRIDFDFGGLTEEQIEIIRQFWVSFDREKMTGEKTGFINIWAVLGSLYSVFRKALKDKGLAYEGMIFREIAEKISGNEPPEASWDMLHFIGFNAINNCEKSLMQWLKKQGKARFCWDYDNSFTGSGPFATAGTFIERNIRLLGNDMPAGWSHESGMTRVQAGVVRRVIAVSSDVAQVKLVSQLVEEIRDLSPENAHHTAVVLADENLLVPVLTSLPENCGDVNITMGYPMKYTQLYTLVKMLLTLQQNSGETSGEAHFRYNDVINVLRHQLIKELFRDDFSGIMSEKVMLSAPVRVPASLLKKSGDAEILFRRASGPSGLTRYLKTVLGWLPQTDKDEEEGRSDSVTDIQVRNEFIYRIMLAVNRIEQLLKDPAISFTTDTFIRLMDRILRASSVPFSGEPLSGIQIMGLLETRTLDFRNLIMLSVNDGVLPAISTGSSFIPANIRIAFGLPDISHQESVFAYHFYRLLQRSENVTFIYNSNSEGIRTGEISRFLLRMKYSGALDPGFQTPGFEIRTNRPLEGKVERTEVHQEILDRQFCGEERGRLSPTAINMWLSCTMKFYYRYVNKLKEPAKASAEIDPAMMGNLLHEVMKRIYAGFAEELISREQIDRVIKDSENIVTLIRETTSGVAGRNFSMKSDGSILITCDILREYVNRILDCDRGLAPFRICGLEVPYDFEIPLLTDARRVRAGGFVDRIDEVKGSRRIVDYKTGKASERISSVSELFRKERTSDYDAWLQTLFYCQAVYKKNQPVTVRPSVYRIRELKEGYDDRLVIRQGREEGFFVDDYLQVREDFLGSLHEAVTLIMNQGEPFVMTEDRTKCRTCPYAVLCMR